MEIARRHLPLHQQDVIDHMFEGQAPADPMAEHRRFACLTTEELAAKYPGDTPEVLQAMQAEVKAKLEAVDIMKEHRTPEQQYAEREEGPPTHDSSGQPYSRNQRRVINKRIAKAAKKAKRK